MKDVSDSGVRKKRMGQNRKMISKKDDDKREKVEGEL